MMTLITSRSAYSPLFPPSNGYLHQARVNWRKKKRSLLAEHISVKMEIHYTNYR